MNHYFCKAKTKRFHLNRHHYAKEQNFFQGTKDFAIYD